MSCPNDLLSTTSEGPPHIHAAALPATHFVDHGQDGLGSWAGRVIDLSRITDISVHGHRGHGEDDVGVEILGWSDTRAQSFTDEPGHPRTLDMSLETFRNDFWPRFCRAAYVRAAAQDARSI